MKALRYLPVVLVLLLAACVTSTDVHVEGGVTVELDAFSGLPNPTWTLTAAQHAELERRLRDLPSARDARLPEGGLGYRGFRLTAAGEDGAGRQIYVTSGLVQIGEAEALLYRDVHGLEAWLREQARVRGYGGALRSSNP